MHLLKQTLKLLYTSLFSACSCSDSTSQIWFDKTIHHSTVKPKEFGHMKEMFPDAMIDESKTITVDYIQSKPKPRLNSIYARGIGSLNDLSFQRRHSETFSAQIFPEDSVKLLESFERWNVGTEGRDVTESSSSMLLAMLNFNFRLNK